MIYVLAMFAISVTLSFIYRRVPLHPLFWMPVFLAIYGSWYYLGLITNGLEVRPHDYLALKYHLLAILSFSVPCVLLIPRNVFENISLWPGTFSLDKILGWVVILLLFSYLLLVFVSGASSKREVKDAVVGSLSIVATVSLIGVMILGLRAVACRYYCDKQKTHSITTFSVVALVTFLVVGERELLFGIILIWFLVSTTAQRSKNAFTYFYTAIFVGVFLVSASQGLKAALIGEVNWERMLVDSVFRSEFAAPGRNFRYLEFVGDDDLIGWEVVATELRRFFLSFIPGADVRSVSLWFNESFRDELGIGGSSGWGFTMVGSAFLAGKVPGVMLYYIAIGVGLSFIIRAGRYSDTLMISYLCIIPILIYATRQDLSYLLNYYFKFALVVNMLIFILSRYLLPRGPAARGGLRSRNALL